MKESSDLAIQKTNDASIVSKLSVETQGYKLYGKRRYLRHVVDKPRNRAPTIRYGYYVRMKCVEDAVRRFLGFGERKRKVVVNLGCGYDTLPLEWLSCNEHLCFIDVDFRELIDKKRKLLDAMAEQSGLEHVTEWTAMGKYRLLGCDLSDIELFKAEFTKICPEYAAEDILFISEVALTYMKTDAANAVVEWCATLPNAHFALVEQIIPGGPNHPFARQMLKHFKKLNSPLQSVLQYGDKQAQADRFRELGWTKVSAITLYEFYLKHEKLQKPLEVEVFFGEYEELALFFHHYCYVFAGPAAKIPSPTSTTSPSAPTSMLHLTYVTTNDPQLLQRRTDYAVAPLSRSLICYGGSGWHSDTLQITENIHDDTLPPIHCAPNIVNHTFTSTRHGPIVIGGRRGSHLNKHCTWISKDTFTPVDLPSDRFISRYRHNAACVNGTRIIICGGMSEDGGIEDSWQTWTLEDGWSTLATNGMKPCPRHSAVFVWVDESDCGILSGGLDARGHALDDIWTIKFASNHLTFIQWNLSDDSRQLLGRFGAKASVNPQRVLIIGGVGPHVVAWRDQVLLLHVDTKSICRLEVECPVQQPILIRHDVCSLNGQCLLTGGDCVCFSFGSTSNEGLMTITSGNRTFSGLHLRSLDKGKGVKAPNSVPSLPATSINMKMFSDEPILLQGMDIGPCQELWSPKYLIEQIGDYSDVLGNCHTYI